MTDWSNKFITVHNHSNNVLENKGLKKPTVVIVKESCFHSNKESIIRIVVLT